MDRARTALAAALAVVAACGTAPKRPAAEAADVNDAPSSASARLAALADEAWQAELRWSPVTATQLGIPGYDDQLPDNSTEAVAARLAARRAMLARAEAIDDGALSPRERITLAVLEHDLRGGIDGAACETELWRVDHLWGPQVWFLDLGGRTKIEDERGERDYLARLAAFGGYVDTHIANLRAGMARGLVAPRMNVERTIRQLEELAGVAPADYALLAAVERAPEAWRDALRGSIAREVERTIAPAYDRYRAFLADELLPVARAEIGLHALPNGERCYRAEIRRHTSRDGAPRELHQLGLDEMARIRAEMTELADKLFPGRELPEVLAMLRDDPKYAFSTRDEVERAAVTAVERAEARLGDVFSLLPEATIGVERLEAHVEKDSPMAYYRRPALEGERRGVYMVNTYLPEKRPRYTAEVLAFHEAVPGHHLQIAIAQELEGVPDFQKNNGTTAFVEGWALYAERLCDEMGLYSGDLDRLGMLSFDAWRAARLVVDTGMHSLGWTRQQAIDYMVANTASTLPDIENEVDRYITWPGQALAYKVGQIEVLRLRQRARDALGDRFDLREFHRRVLRSGAVPLTVLAAEIDRWIEGG